MLQKVKKNTLSLSQKAAEKDGVICCFTDHVNNKK